MILSDLKEKCFFSYGDWNSLSKKENAGDDFILKGSQIENSAESEKIINKKFDFIFASDILYENSNYLDLVNLFDSFLLTNGFVFIVSKMFYYGNGGGVYEFMEFCDKDGRFRVSTEAELKDKIGGNQRAILKLTRTIL